MMDVMDLVTAREMLVSSAEYNDRFNKFDDGERDADMQCCM